MTAAKDREKALATPTGSVFSQEFHKLLSVPKNRQMMLSQIREELEYNVVGYCIRHKKRRHHPQSLVSSSALKKISFAEYLKIKQ